MSLHFPRPMSDFTTDAWNSGSCNKYFRGSGNILVLVHKSGRGYTFRGVAVSWQWHRNHTAMRACAVSQSRPGWLPTRSNQLTRRRNRRRSRSLPPVFCSSANSAVPHLPSSTTIASPVLKCRMLCNLQSLSSCFNNNSTSQLCFIVELHTRRISCTSPFNVTLFSSDAFKKKKTGFHFQGNRVSAAGV